MIKKVVGIVLIVAGGVLVVFLLTYGGPVFPHIIGPAVAVAVGTTLAAANSNGSKSAE